MATMASLSSLYGARGADCLAALLQGSPLLKALENYSGWEQDSTTFDYIPSPGTATVNKRSLNGELSASPSVIAMPSPISATLAAMYDAFKIDVSYKRDEEKGLSEIKNYLPKHLNRKWKDFAKGLEVLLMQGTGAGTPAEIKGLKTILNGTDDIPGYTGMKRVINAATYGAAAVKSLDLTGTTNDDRLANLIEDAKSMVNTDGAVWVATSKVQSKVSRIADAKRASDFTTNAYGQTIQTLWGIPIVTLNTGSILYTEPDDTATPVNETTSLYLANFGELKTSLVSNSGLEYYEWDVKENEQSGLERWEVRAQWKIEDPESILRIRNLKI